jgi:hypothetical protein
MAVGFGFSVSDLFAGLKLIKDSIEAFHDAKGSSADYALLVTEILSLQDGLEAVEGLHSEQSLPENQNAALERAIYACQETVDGFLSSISKYQPHLSPRASGLQSNYVKVKWALCKKEDVARFRAQLGRHTSSINMLLITFQARENLQARRPGDSLTICKGEDDCTAEMLRGLSLDQRRIFLATMQQNKQLMQGIEELRTMLYVQAAIPPQVLLQQPVILLDPLGKTVPFHLDFIDSSECFMAVLRARFSNAGVTRAGLSKLDNRDFSIQDSRRKRPIDVDQNWESVFRAGQNVDMRMVFHRFACPPRTCPVCLAFNEDDDEQIYCQACGLCYQNIQASSSRDWDGHIFNGHVRIAGEEIPYVVRQPGMKPEMKVFRPIKEPEDDLFEVFRRVQLVSQPIDLLNARYPALQLIEDFSRFAELLEGIPDSTSVHLEDVQVLGKRAVEHLLQQRSNFPRFASFAQFEQARKHLAKESLQLRQDIDSLVQNLYNDENTKLLVKYIEKTCPSQHGRNYYTGVLTRMVKSSDFTRTKTSRVRSAERMQWLLLDGRPK